MQLNKINLANIVAIGHQNGQLGVVIDRGEDLEYIEIPAPIAAYQGLEQLDLIVNSDFSQLSASEITLTPELDCPEAIAMLPVKSSATAAIGYDETEQVLQIKFAQGATYQYYDVQVEVWEDFVEADSKGQFFHAQIKGYYESARIDQED